MSIADGILGELRMADILTFLTVQRCCSISSAARELMVTPSQVSKTISRLEELLGSPLFARSAAGIALLEDGRRLVPKFEQMIELARTLGDHTAAAPHVLGIAAPSYLASFFVPLIAAEAPPYRIRVFELPPAQIRAQMASGQFDLVLGIGELPQSTTWESHAAGEIEKALFASPRTAKQLGNGPIEKAALADLPIISPIYLTDASFLPVDDDCPITRRERTVGHETMTFGLGLAIAARTDQLVFGPVIGALPFLESGALVKIGVEGWSLRDVVRVVYNTERITRSQQRNIVSAIERGIASVGY